MVHENSIFGFSPGKTIDKDNVNPVRKAGADEVINTTRLGEKILGYGGTVPVEIYVTSGRIDSIKALPNNETTDVFQRLYDEGLMKAWNGHTLKEAVSLDVDGVTGATYSSNAVIGNVRCGVDYGISRRRRSHHCSCQSAIQIDSATAQCGDTRILGRGVYQLCNDAEFLRSWFHVFISRSGHRCPFDCWINLSGV